MYKALVFVLLVAVVAEARGRNVYVYVYHKMLKTIYSFGETLSIFHYHDQAKILR